jgi:diguanylate cyclase (GGDEF)-like protein
MIKKYEEIDVSFKIKKPNKWVVLLISLVLVLFLGLTDYISGYELSFSIFYLIPISISIILANMRIGIIISVFSTCVWLSADLLDNHKYTYMLIPYWNAIMRLGYFILHTLLLSQVLKLYNEAKSNSFIDPLTNIANRRFFREILQRELHKSGRSNLPITIAYIDLDNFKNLNDTFGHMTGDELLKMIAGRISIMIRSYDLIARLGGDEFALILPDTDLENAKLIIERIRNELLNQIKEKKWLVTLSFGVIIFTDFNLSIEEMLHKADELMYIVKQNGKNNAKYQIYPSTNLTGS